MHYVDLCQTCAHCTSKVYTYLFVTTWDRHVPVRATSSFASPTSMYSRSMLRLCNSVCTCASPANTHQVWLASRFVVVCIGSMPNSELFRDSLSLSADGGIVTDSSLRTSHPSGDVFAAGDVACAPVPLMGGEKGDFFSTAMRSEHVKTARDMGAYAATSMLGGNDVQLPYNPVPHIYSRWVCA